MDLRRETDIEHRRRIAIAQQVQIEQLLRVLKSKCDEVEALKGNPEALQQTLALIETLTKQKTAAAEAVAGTPKKKDRAIARSVSNSGPPSSPSCRT